ncbi:MAG: bifunctional phosphopantothenoylcysteine decarboxylase/phosphopantothenate--cysteine ligase CoaBC [Parvibaculales bacterium]
MSDLLRGKRILLIIGGGIAAYKTPELVRQLKGSGAQVRCVLTAGGAQFVTPLTLGSVSGDKVYESLFDLTDETEMGHIQLSRDADLIVVAPATADLMAKMAQGLAGDLASTALLATDKPVLLAPAMNVRMWLHPATQRNLQTLQQDGIEVIGPDSGDMACGETGPGRMSEPDTITAAVIRKLGAGTKPLAGKRALITAGPTHEPIDPVRYIANRSSGKQGYAIAEAVAGLGAETVLVSGPTALTAPANVTLEAVETAEEMKQACEDHLPSCIAVLSAAVADWRSAATSNAKIKKQQNNAPPALTLTENPDILAHLSRHPQRPDLLVGFAAETDDVIGNARDKLARKGCDWIVANDVSPETGVMGGSDNTVHIIDKSNHEAWEKMSKVDVARKLAARIADHFSADHFSADAAH